MTLCCDAKSMLAKAIAKEADASFIGMKSGTILDKYVGESDKLVTAIFSLAQKISPTVIFIDEVDTLLKKREALQSGSASSIGSMLGTLMSEWDGLNSDGRGIYTLQYTEHSTA
jgi:ATPase family AAA domain-containing protein 1